MSRAEFRGAHERRWSRRGQGVVLRQPQCLSPTTFLARHDRPLSPMHLIGGCTAKWRRQAETA